MSPEFLAQLDMTAKKKRTLPDGLKREIKARLRALQAEERKVAAQMAICLGIDVGLKRAGSTWAGWVSETGNYPGADVMITICEKFNVTMDWLYRGQAKGMPAERFIRLEMRMAGLDPDTATEENARKVAQRLAFAARQAG